MSKQIEAVYENGVLRPQEPLDLKQNTRVRLTIESPGGPPKLPGTLRELFGSIDLGCPTNADNQSIEADLASEYAGTNEEAV